MRLSVVLTATMLGCAYVGEPPANGRVDDSPVRTGSLVYHLRPAAGRYDASAIATYVNRTGRPVYFRRCMPDSDTPMYDVRRTGPDSTRSSLVGLAWACVGGVPTGLVPPAGSVTVQAWLGGTTSSSATPTTGPEAGLGHFRVVLALCAEAVNDSDLCTPLPMLESQSNAFEVRWGGP